jgi:dihydrofolate synthase/folylpolyglutamate synthase
MSSAVNKISTFNKFGSVLGLERIQELLRRLGNPQKDLKIIHIGGTNGKGSTSRMVYQILREAGYNVGIYTSPFLEVFNERIEYNGEMIPDEYLEKYADIVEKEARAMCDDGLLSPTEFDSNFYWIYVFCSDGS